MFSAQQVIDMLELTKDNFEQEVINSDVPVIVDFWAEWCGPCKTMAPVFEETSKDYEGKVKFAKLNVEEHNDLAAKHGVMSIPTMVIFKDGKELDRIVGAMPKEKLKEEIDKRIKG